MGEYSFSFISFELGLFSFCTFSCFFGEYQRMPLEKQQEAEVFLDVAFGSRVKEGAMNYRTTNTPIQIQRTDLGAQISWFCFWQVANITLRVFQSERKPWSKENALHNVGSDFPSEAFFFWSKWCVLFRSESRLPQVIKLITKHGLLSIF